jgi:hypothetical protein
MRPFLNNVSELNVIHILGSLIPLPLQTQVHTDRDQAGSLRDERLPPTNSSSLYGNTPVHNITEIPSVAICSNYATAIAPATTCMPPQTSPWSPGEVAQVVIGSVALFVAIVALVLKYFRRMSRKVCLAFSLISSLRLTVIVSSRRIQKQHK